MYRVTFLDRGIPQLHPPIRGRNNTDSLHFEEGIEKQLMLDSGDREQGSLLTLKQTAIFFSAMNSYANPVALVRIMGTAPRLQQLN